MNINQAYNRGLSDAESVVMEIFKKVIRNEESESFNNPEMEKLKQALIPFVKHIYGMASKDTSNVGKFVSKTIINPSLELIKTI